MSEPDTDESRRRIRRALVSVSDKTGLESLARALHAAGVVLVSTGSTAQHIAAAGVPVTKVEEVTGFPECLDGRVKTLHPGIHAGLLADLTRPAHAAELGRLGIEPFDLLVVNLYPFEATVASGAAPEECVEQIDIGGPAMVRAAAKNHASIAVVVSPGRYDALRQAVVDGGFTDAERQSLAAEAFAHTASYDVAVASWMGSQGSGASPFPSWIGATWTLGEQLRYGENPHQAAAIYRSGPGRRGLAVAEQLHGKPMSYNNYLDADAAHRAAYDFAQPAVAVIKHTNPCGIAIGKDVAEAYVRAHATDPVSSFGGVVAANRPVSRAMAEQLQSIFTEVVVAPGFDADALDVLTRKANIRLLLAEAPGEQAVESRPVSGGLLLQQRDRLHASGDDPSTWRQATGGAVDEKMMADLVFAWRACRSVKSNAILLARAGAAVGIGMGQVNRVDSARLAVSRAGERASGSVAASDAFFPFPDGLEVLMAAGVSAVVQPGGSVRDDDVVAAAAAAGVPLFLTGTRHFLH